MQPVEAPLDLDAPLLRDAARGDIRDYFGSIDQQKLLALVAERVSDRRVLKLLRQCLEAGVMEDGVFSETVSETPQGGVMTAPTQSRTSIGRAVTAADDPAAAAAAIAAEVAQAI